MAIKVLQVCECYIIFVYQSRKRKRRPSIWAMFPYPHTHLGLLYGEEECFFPAKRLARELIYEHARPGPDFKFRLTNFDFLFSYTSNTLLYSPQYIPCFLFRILGVTYVNFNVVRMKNKLYSILRPLAYVPWEEKSFLRNPVLPYDKKSILEASS
jgi:hypothetical protein